MFEAVLKNDHYRFQFGANDLRSVKIYINGDGSRWSIVFLHSQQILQTKKYLNISYI